jgi:hypothetical protein
MLLGRRLRRSRNGTGKDGGQSAAMDYETDGH